MKERTQAHLYALILMLLCVGSIVVRAATITVTNTADSGPGSLRAALASAANGDIIDATGLSGTITLTSGELVISNGVSVNGPGPATLAINGNFPNTTNSVFRITNATTVTISGLTITNGHAFKGGGVNSFQSALTLSNCLLIGNSAYIGGGIVSLGGPSISTKLMIINSLISSNSAMVGGAIYNWGEVGPATLIIVGSTISGNWADAAGGGGIKNDGSPSGNATLAITNSTISNNLTTGYGGGIQNDGVQGHATLTLVKSTVSGNSASSLGGGGIYNDGSDGGMATVTVMNSTISSNSGGSWGGGIRNGSPSSAGNAILTLISSTLSRNSASVGGGIYNLRGQIQIGNTILNGGSSGTNISNSSATLTSLGYNLSSDSGGGFLTNATDQIYTDPILGPLQDNGGPVFTHGLLNGSPAFDKGKNLSGDVTDERGFLRTFDDPGIPNATDGDGTDIGAYEAFELRITAVEKTGDDLRLSFTSLSGIYYELETRSNLLTGAWSAFGENLPGNGGITQIIVTNALTQPQQFYRIHQLP